ncbi:nuclear UL24 [Colobine gammaherpesvirus 1]|uniref:Nuclear UL24 n=1 Tax=Colobine gammaherpesvirus 1 TaxID=2597325 RepID=A0A5B8G8X2_9GAMA|nr:nuclear UL24 [Colobine gammaherpesvirus 1]QDQ69228.1 nuclear UL24 [Colobine gammaherpesvirus 1]
MVGTDEREAKKHLKRLPAARKYAGVRAHLKTYRQIVTYSTLSEILSFLCIRPESPSIGTHKLFFEVRLGLRIADCIITIQGGACPLCYIIELKTCLGNSIPLTDTVRKSQRVEGLSQLTDSVRYLTQAVPPGREVWAVVPVLIFKNQKTLKTVHCETPLRSPATIQTTTARLDTFLARRQDERVREMLSKVSQATHMVRSRAVLDTAPGLRAIRAQTIPRRSKARRSQSASPKTVT